MEIKDTVPVLVKRKGTERNKLVGSMTDLYPDSSIYCLGKSPNFSKSSIVPVAKWGKDNTNLTRWVEESMGDMQKKGHITGTR